jgi:hypothetical protein
VGSQIAFLVIAAVVVVGYAFFVRKRSRRDDANGLMDLEIGDQDGGHHGGHQAAVVTAAAVVTVAAAVTTSRS